MSGYILTVLLLAWAPTLAGGHCEGTTLVDTYGYALLEDSRDLPDITLRAITIRFCLMRDLDLQIWRRSEDNLFTLEWSLRITPPSLGQDIVHDIPPSDVIRLRPSEHKLGLYVPDRQDLPIFAKWGPGEHQTFYSEEDGPFLLNKTYAFMTDLVNPIAFNITLCGNAGCGSDVQRPTRPASTITTTTEATTVPPLLCNLVNRRAGGRALLESSRALPGGILRGVRVRSCLLQPYLLQVWEWAGTAGYTLVWQRWVVPITDDGSMQVVLFNAEEYLVSSATYRAGVQLDPYVTLLVPDTQRDPDLMLLESREARDFSPCRSANFRPAAFKWDLALDFCTTPDCSPSNDIEEYLPYNSPCPTEPPFMVTSSTTMSSSSPSPVTSPTTMPMSPTTMMTSPTTMMTSPTTMMSPPTMMTSPTTMTMSPTTMMTSPPTMMTSPPTMMTSPPTMTMSPTTMMTSPPTMTTSRTTMIPTMIITDRATTQFSSRPTTSTPTTTRMVSERTSDIPMTTDAMTMSRPVPTTQIPNTITTQSSSKPTSIISTLTTSTANIPTRESSSMSTFMDTTTMSSSTTRGVNIMTTLMMATTVMEDTSMLPTTKRPMPSTRKPSTITSTTTRTTTMRPTTMRTTTMRTTTTTKATTRKATTQRPKTTTKKMVKPTQSQNNIVKNTNAKAAAANGSNNGRGIHPKVAIGTIIMTGILNCLLMLPFL